MRATTTRHGTVAATCAAVILMLAAVLGSPSQAVAETERGGHFSEDEHRMFRNFIYDSFSPFFEIVGIDTMPGALDEFGQSLQSFPPELCPAVVDFALFRSQLVQSVYKGTDIPKKKQNLLIAHILFELAGVPWGPLSEVKPEDQPAVLEAKDHVKEYLANAEERLGMVHRHCVENHLRRAGLVSVNRLTTNYAPTPIEFRMRELYESLVPVAAWILKLSRESARQDQLADLESIIDSMEQKYGLSVPGSH